MAHNVCRLYFYRGSAHLGLNQYAEASQDLACLLQIEPDNPHIIEQRAHAYYYQGRREKEIQMWTRGLSLDSIKIGARFFRGRAFQDQGRYTEAQADYHWILSVQPTDHSAVYRCMDSILNSQASANQAIQISRSVISLL